MAVWPSPSTERSSSISGINRSLLNGLGCWPCGRTILVGRLPDVCADLVPDDLWARVAPLLPPASERRYRYPGRLRVPDRAALAGILYVLRTGVAWCDVPAETVGCSGVTAWRRLRDWTDAGVWPRLHAALLTELRRTALLDLDDCAVDGSHVQALKGGSTWALPRLTAPVPGRSII
jgi:transposase